MTTSWSPSTSSIPTWTYAWGAGGATDKLNFHTTPGLAMSEGRNAPVMVHEVSVADEQARIVLSTGAVPRLIVPGGPFEVMKTREFSVPVRIAGGRGPYTGVGDLPAGFSLEPRGDELVLVGSVKRKGPTTSPTRYATPRAMLRIR